MSGDILHDPEEANQVASSLVFLHRVGLTPVVTHGAGVFTGQKSAKIRALLDSLPDEEEEDEDGMPVAELQEALDSAREYMEKANHTLVSAMESLGIPSAAWPLGIFDTEPSTSYKGPFEGIVGDIVHVRTSALLDSIEEGRIPVVASMGWYTAPLTAPISASEGDDDVGSGIGSGSRALSAVVEEEAHPQPRALTFPTHNAVEALSRSLQPLKVIHLRREGALCRRDGSVIPHISLARDMETLTDPEGGPDSLQHADAWLLRDISRLLRGDTLSVGATVSVTKPSLLASELFSHQGGGTLISRGERVLTYNEIPRDLEPEMKSLLETAFQAQLPNDFFATISQRFRKMYVLESCRAVAIVTNLGGIPYLDKFAVSPTAQGEGLGMEIWKTLVSNEPKLFWRSRRKNAVNPWYFQQADGTLKVESKLEGVTPWTVFWRGLEYSEIFQAVEEAAKLPPTFSRQPGTIPETTLFPSSAGDSRPGMK